MKFTNLLLHDVFVFFCLGFFFCCSCFVVFDCLLFFVCLFAVVFLYISICCVMYFLYGELSNVRNTTYSHIYSHMNIYTLKGLYLYILFKWHVTYYLPYCCGLRKPMFTLQPARKACLIKNGSCVAIAIISTHDFHNGWCGVGNSAVMVGVGKHTIRLFVSDNNNMLIVCVCACASLT